MMRLEWFILAQLVSPSKLFETEYSFSFSLLQLAIFMDMWTVCTHVCSLVCSGVSLQDFNGFPPS